MEIKSYLKPACDQCPLLSPKVRATDLYADNCIVGRTIFISCEYRNCCDVIEQYLTGAMKKPENCVSFEAPSAGPVNHHHTATFACVPDSHILENEMAKTLGKEKDIDIPPFCNKSFMTH